MSNIEKSATLVDVLKDMMEDQFEVMFQPTIRDEGLDIIVTKSFNGKFANMKVHVDFYDHDLSVLSEEQILIYHILRMRESLNTSRGVMVNE